jgi:hypothetical protein
MSLAQYSERLTLLDAFIKIIKAEYPNEWRRFCQLASLLEDSGGSPEEAARRRLSRINQNYDASMSWVSGGRAGDRGLYEATEIQGKLIDQFVRAIHAEQWSIVGCLKGDRKPASVPVERIEGDVFRFNTNKLRLHDGTEVSDVCVVPAIPAPPPAETRGPKTRGRKPGAASSMKNQADQAARTMLAGGKSDCQNVLERRRSTGRNSPEWSGSSLAPRRNATTSGRSKSTSAAP